MRARRRLVLLAAAAAMSLPASPSVAHSGAAEAVGGSVVPVVVRPGPGGRAAWYVQDSLGGGDAFRGFHYGRLDRGDRPLMGDWDGDGVRTPGVWRAGAAEFHLRNDLSGGAADVVFRYGKRYVTPGQNVTPRVVSDSPIVGDWDGDGVETVGVARFIARCGVSGGDVIGCTGPQRIHWHLRNSNTAGPADMDFHYGEGFAQPVVGDWDGDGTTTIGVTLPDQRQERWMLRNSNAGGRAEFDYLFGSHTPFPLVGDWDGDGDDTAGVIHRSDQTRWSLKNDHGAGAADVELHYGREADRFLIGQRSRTE